MAKICYCWHQISPKSNTIFKSSSSSSSSSRFITIIIRQHLSDRQRQLPIATDGVARSVCLCVCVCLSVGHVREFYKICCTDRDAVSRADSCGPKEPLIKWDRNSPRERAILWVIRPI